MEKKEYSCILKVNKDDETDKSILFGTVGLIEGEKFIGKEIHDKDIVRSRQYDEDWMYSNQWQSYVTMNEIEFMYNGKKEKVVYRSKIRTRQRNLSISDTRYNPMRLRCSCCD